MISLGFDAKTAAGGSPTPSGGHGIQRAGPKRAGAAGAAATTQSIERLVRITTTRGLV